MKFRVENELERIQRQAKALHELARDIQEGNISIINTLLDVQRVEREIKQGGRPVWDYYIAITPGGEHVRCYDRNVPEEFALITPDHPSRHVYYDVENKLRPEYWGLHRWRNDNAS